jgi:hypothetical protein
VIAHRVNDAAELTAPSRQLDRCCGANGNCRAFNGTIVAILLQKSLDLIHVFAHRAGLYTDEGQLIGEEIVCHIVPHMGLCDCRLDRGAQKVVDKLSHSKRLGQTQRILLCQRMTIGLVMTVFTTD